MSRNVSKAIDFDNDDTNNEINTKKLTSNLDDDQLIKNDNENVKIDSLNSKLNPSKEMKQNGKTFACACVLDPSCSTVIVSYSDGVLQLWPLIGAVAMDKHVSEVLHDIE